CGRQTESLSTFQRARTVLGDEFGVEPGPELRSMEQAVLRQDPQLDWTASPAVVASEKAAAPVARGKLPTPLTAFIGRQQQLSELCRDVAATRLVTLTGTG